MTNLTTVFEDKGKRTLYEIAFTIIAFDLLALIGNLFVSNKLAYTLGVILGCLTAEFMIFHMYHTIEKVVLLDKKRASSKTRLYAFLRMIVMVAALAFSALNPDYLNVFGCLIGIMALKASALLQPLADKMVLKIICKGG